MINGNWLNTQKLYINQSLLKSDYTQTQHSYSNIQTLMT